MIFNLILLGVLYVSIWAIMLIDKIPKGKVTMTWIFLAIGLVIGGGAGTGITYKIMDKKIKNMKPVVVKEVVAEKQQDIIIQLTEPQLVKDICAQGDALLCRELLCLQFSRGIDSQTSGKQCEEISNLHNSIKIMDYCYGMDDPQKCLDVFWRRK